MPALFDTVRQPLVQRRFVVCGRKVAAFVEYANFVTWNAKKSVLEFLAIGNHSLVDAENHIVYSCT